MDNPATLLTAIMFVTVLGMAIGNLLMALSDVAGGLRKPALPGVHLAWMVLLLLASLALFWETTAILDIEDWRFLDFLYLIVGPMLVLFAVSVISSPVPAAEGADGMSAYFAVSGRFFLMLALEQAWILGLDVRYGTLGMISLPNGLLVAVFLGLMLSRNQTVHVAGTVITALAMGLSIVWQAASGG